MAAAALAVGSGANFNSTSANPSNVFTAGTISRSNSKASAAILTASNIVPGNTATGTVDIKNTGTASADADACLCDSASPAPRPPR
jgi:spore coat-associated protein N